MTQELYINGERCDLYDKEPIPLIFDSPFFTDINKIVSNRTHSIKIPKTAHNLRLIKFSHRTDNDNKFPYKRHVADYYLNGMEIIRDGCAVLWSIAEDIEIQLIWGNINAFKELIDMKSLRDIYQPRNLPDEELKPDPDEAMLLWDDDTQYWTGDQNNPVPGPYYWARINYGVGRADNRYFRPVVTAGWILDRLAEHKNITFDLLPETRQVVDNLIFPLFSRNTSETSWLRWGSDNSMLYPNPYGEKPLNGIRMIHGINYTDYNPKDEKLAKEIGVWVHYADHTKYICFQSGKCRIWGEVSFLSDNFDGFSIIIIVDEYFTITHNSQLSADGLRHEVNLDCITEADAYSNFQFQIRYKGLNQKKLPTFLKGKFNIAVKRPDVVYGTYYPILPNLPDISTSAFLKLLMQITGTFPYVSKNHSNVIHFTSIDTLYNNVNNLNVFDWTNKVLMHSRYSNDPSQMEFKYGSYAQNNRCLWKDDKTVEIDASGYLTVESEHLEKEKELLKLEIPATDMKDGEIFIPLFTRESEEIVKENDVKPRVLVGGIDVLLDGNRRSLPYFSKIAGNFLTKFLLTFDGENGILKKYYTKYQKIIRSPKVIQVKCLLNEYDLSKLDLTVPVYFEQFGQYYVILKIQSNNGVSDCELLEID